jgi:CysZ protein
MLGAFRKAFTQLLTDPRLWKYVIWSAVLSLLSFLALWALLGGALHFLATYVERFRTALQWGGYTVSFVAALLLFPTTFILVQSLFQEAVADRVDEKYYAHLPSANGPSIREGIVRGVRFFLLLLTINLLALPIYLTLLVAFGSGAVVFLLVNGFLTGREYFEIVALRRLSGAQVDGTRRGSRFKVFLTGTAITGMGAIPILNLLVPLVGVAAMVHIYHQAAQTDRPSLS